MPGDANGDLEASAGDLGILAAQYGQSAPWLAGDFTGDGVVSVGHLGVLAASYGQTLSPAVLGYTSDDATVAGSDLSVPGGSCGSLAIAGTSRLAVEAAAETAADLLASASQPDTSGLVPIPASPIVGDRAARSAMLGDISSRRSTANPTAMNAARLAGLSILASPHRSGQLIQEPTASTQVLGHGRPAEDMGVLDLLNLHELAFPLAVRTESAIRP